MFRILFQGDLFADYFQIYLRDVSDPALPDDYTAEAINRALMIGPTAVIVHTARNMTVTVTVEWHDRRPDFDESLFQHGVEATFSCPTGVLVLAGLTDDDAKAPHLTVPPGLLGVRASMAGLDTLDETGLDGGDTYLLQLWPAASPQDVSVLKAWAGS